MGLGCKKDVYLQIMVNCIVCSFILCISFVLFLFENVNIREVFSWVGFHDGCPQTMAWGPIGHYKCSSCSFSSILDCYWFRPIPLAENNMVSGLSQKWFRLQVTTSTSTYPRQTIWKWKCFERGGYFRPFATVPQYHSLFLLAYPFNTSWCKLYFLILNTLPNVFSWRMALPWTW